MKYFSVKNFDNFQHGHRRAFPWVKIYKTLLDDYDFLSLPDDLKYVFIGLILLSSKAGIKLPLDANYLKTRLGFQGRLNLTPLFERGMLIPYRGRPTLTQSKGEEEEEENKEEENMCRADATELLQFLNEKAGRQFEVNGANLDLVMARLKEPGRTKEQLRMMVARQIVKWESDEKMAQYLRPATLFNKMKCAQYLGEE